MPGYQYLDNSPYMQAADTLSGAGNTMGNLFVRLQMLKYQQAMQQQQMAMQQALVNAQLQNYQAQAGYHQAQQGYLGAQTGRVGAQTQIDLAKLDAANKLGAGMRTQYPFEAPIDMAHGPTLEAGAKLGMGDIAEQAARSMALSGRAGNLLMPHNVPANAIAMGPFNQLAGIGPMQIPQGNMYQLPGGQPVVNPRPFLHNVPPGNEVMDAANNVVGQNPKPATDPLHSQIIVNLVKDLASGNIENPYAITNASPEQIQLYNAATNALGLVKGTMGQAMPGAAPPPPAATEIPTFRSEAEARAAGIKPGQKIRIIGVGEGFLN